MILLSRRATKGKGEYGGRLFSELLSEKRGGNGHKLKHRKVHLTKKKTPFCCEGSQVVEQVAKRGCGVSVMEIKHLTGEGLEQSALADSALSKEIDLYGL